MVTKNGPPEPGTMAAIPGAIESLSALLAGELPCAFVDTLRAAGIHFTAAGDARGTLALWEKDPLAIAISNDVSMVAALAGAHFGVVMGLAAEPATMRAMIAAGAIDVIAPAADVAHIQERLSILAMRRANAAQPTRERGILDVVAVVSEVLSAGGVTAVEEALGLLGQSLSLDEVYVLEEHSHPLTGEPAFTQHWGWHRRPQPMDPSMRPMLNTRYSKTPAVMLAWRERLSKGEAICAYASEDDEIGRALGLRGIVASIRLPVMVGGRLWGSVGFDDWSEPRAWTATEIAALRVAASGIAATVAWQLSADSLQRGEARYREVFENANDLIYTTDMELRFTSVNRAVELALGYAKDEIVGQHASLILPPEAIPLVAAMFERKRVGQAESTSYELILLAKDGHHVPVEVVTRLISEGGVAAGTQGIARDITRRQAAEAALHEQEQALRRALEMNQNIMASASDVILSTNVEGVIEYVNERAFEATGYTREELIGQHYTFLAPPGQGETINAELLGLVEANPVAHAELPLRKKDGSLRWFAWGIAPLLEGGENLGQVACGHDITLQREAEAAILTLASVVESSADAIITTAPGGEIVSWNGAAERLYGYTEAEAVHRNMRALLSREDYPRAAAIMEAIRNGTTMPNQELSMIRKDGSLIDVSATMFPIRDATGEIVLIGGISRDVTEEKRAARELAQLGAIVNSATDSIFTTNLLGELTSWNDAAERTLGYHKAEVLGKRLYFLVPSNQRKRALEIGRRINAGHAIDGFEMEVVCKDQTCRLVDFTAFPMRDAGGRVTGMAGIIRDVTAQRAAEDADRERREVIALAYRTLNVGIVVTEEDGRVQTVNDCALRIFGRRREQFVGRPYWDVLPERWRPVAAQLHIERMAAPDGSSGNTREWQIAMLDGSQRTVTSVTGRFDRRDGTRCLVVAGIDITASKQAEEQLARLAAIVESSGDAIISGDLDGRITTWNHGAEQLFGWSAAEAMGKSIAFLYPPGSDDDAAAVIGTLARGGRTDRVETRVLAKGGQMVDVSISLFGVRDATGELVSIGGVGRDISEQKRTREELQRRVADLQSLYRLRVRLAESESDAAILAAGLDALVEVMHAESAAARVGYDGMRMKIVSSRTLSERCVRRINDEDAPALRDMGGKPFMIPDVQAWAGYGTMRDALLEEGIRSFFGVPLVGGDRAFGTLSVYYHEVRDYTPEEVAIAQTIAGSVAFAMEQRAAASALQSSTERFQAVAAATNDAIWDLNVADGAIWWSAGFGGLFGYAAEEILPRLDFWEALIHPSDRDRVLAGFRAALLGADEFWTDEYEFLRADGTYANIFDRGCIIRDDRGIAVRMLGSKVDVTALRNAEMEAREGERFLSAIIDNSPLGVQVYGPDGTSLRMNEARREFLGAPGTDFGIGSFNALSDPSMIANGQAGHYARAYAGETIERRDDHMEPVPASGWNPSPGPRWFDQWLFPVKDDGGNVVAVVSLVNDVSERHQSQEDLRTAQQYLQSVVSNAPLLMFVWDRDGNFRMAAGAAVTGLLGDDGANAASGNVFELFADQPAITDAVRGGLEGNSTAFEMSFGGRLWESQYTPMRDTGGEITGVIGVSTDVTGRKRAEQERGVAEQRLVALAESLPVILFALDMDGVLTLATGKGLHSLTDDPASVIGKSFVSVTRSQQMEASIVRALTGESFTAISAIGDEWFETHFEPIRDADGTLHGTIGVSLDITERRKTEEALLQAQKLESLGILAGGIAHDFNNLLVGIMGNAGLALVELPPDSGARETIEEIELACQRAADLARQMLAYSGKGRFVVQRIDLSSLVEEMTQLLRVSISKSATMDYHFEKGLPSVEVDTTQLRQVVMNLVVNASDAIDETGGTIAVTTGVMFADREYLAGTYLPHDIAEGEYVFLEVADTGKGMDTDTRAKIFDPFFTTKFTGRGLGLAAVLGIVRGHRGAIKVMSEPGLGTTFRLLLPSAGAMPGSAGANEARPPKVWRASGTILLADDELTVRTVTSRALESFGFKVIRAPDGQAAVEEFAAHRHDIVCVLLDLTMPRMNGEEALAAILHMDPDARVVLMSGYAEQEALARFTGKGLAGFVQKPYDMERLRSVIRSVLEAPTASREDWRKAAGD